MRRPLALGLVVAAHVALALSGGRAGAQGLYYRSIPIGERAIGMGGAYTGIADDPSATYYNPGGLMSGGRFQLLGSLSSIVFTNRTIDDAFESPTTTQNLSSNRTTTIPHFIGTVIQFGKKRGGEFPYALAYSSFELAREQINSGFTQGDEQAGADLRLGNNYRMRWWGVSFAGRVSKKLSLGISAFLSYQTNNYNEDLGLQSGGTLQDNGVRVGGQSVTSSSSVNYDAWHFVFRLGALYRVNSRWQIGFMFQPPGAPLSQKGNIFRRVVTDLEGQESRFFLFDQDSLAASAPIPWEVRAGAEYKVNALTTLAFDASITAGVRDRNILTPPVDVEALAGSLGAYFANSTERRWTPNAAIGAEHLFGKVVVSGGLMTNISSAPNLPATSEEYSPPQINVYGAAFALGVDAAGYRLTLGANGYFGRGDAYTFTVDQEAIVTGYTRTKSTLSAIVLYVAGAVSVASRGASDVQRKYKERKARKQKENGDPEESSGDDVTLDEDASSDGAETLSGDETETPAATEGETTSTEAEASSETAEPAGDADEPAEAP